GPAGRPAPEGDGAGPGGRGPSGPGRERPGGTGAPLDRIQGLLLDLDGVLYIGDRPVPGAAGALDRIRKSGRPVRFLSNSTRRSRASIASRLRGMGFTIDDREILTPAVATADMLRREGKTAFLLTTGDTHRDFEEAGVTLTDDRPDAVVVGDAGDRFTYALLNRAMRMVLSGAEIIALEKDRIWMGTDGPMLSAGPFVAALEYATGREASCVGKPSPVFFAAALEGLGVPTPGAAMVGDDIETDIGGAQRCGIQGILVRTGKFREETLARSGIDPDFVIGSVADLPNLLS
ncbi:MAG TPA: TIGR01458 family HAD-type hydrolase, partial [Methanomicrobiales archaeon]|nr:TIGR01458 family HAD-type hydrolase [Methanomicrobiales archaeon]